MLHKLSDASRGLWPARARRLSDSRQRRLLGSARIEGHGGLTALYLSGSPYEMGYQQGALARGLIHAYRQAAYDYVLPQVPGPKRLGKPLLFHYASGYWITVPAELQEEMKGIADGAGVHPIEVLVSAAIWEILLVSGCSEFAATGPVTADGSLLHGYNYDLMRPEHALIQPYLAAIFFRPASGIPFCTVNTVGSVGANAGMNEAGISVAWDNTYLRDKELFRDIALPVVPFIVTLRRLLQYAHTLDEAIGIVTGSLPRPLADIVIIGSAHEGRAVALETAGHKFAVREMDGGAIWSTNCFRSAELAAYDRRGDGRGLDEALAWQSFPRHLAYRDLLAANHGRLDPGLAASFLRDPYPREKGGYLHPAPLPRATICRDITSFSLVMEPGKGRLWVSDTDLPACQGSLYAFSLTGAGRLPELDMAPTGYRAALRAARCFAQRDRVGIRAALEEAAARDGPSAPLLLMTAVLEGLEGHEARTTAHLQEVVARFAGTPAALLATAWLGVGGDADAPSVPFPSAIRPAITLQPGATWQERAIVTPA
jgi:hypothetical protein